MDEQNSSVDQMAPKNNSMVLVVAVVLVLLVGGLAYTQRHLIKSMLGGTTAPVVDDSKVIPVTNVEPTPTNETPLAGTGSGNLVNAVEVTYTSSGFSPAKITVKKGQTVKFINRSGSPMSVASDPHPTHTIYPEFDQYKTTFKGKTEFDFVFGKVGTWGYHNHAKPTDTGTVVVTE